MAKELGESTWLGRDVFRAVGPVLEAPAEAMREIEVGLFELVEAYRTVLTTVRHTGKAHEIEAETITVRQCMLDIMDAMQARESIEFDQIVLGPAAAAPTISVLVASFLAILELTRLGVLRVYQSGTEASVPVGPIHMRRVIDPDDRAWTEQLADIL